MKPTGLFLLAGLIAVLGKGVKKLDGVDKSVECVRKEKTLGLTIVQGIDGMPGKDGLKGQPGDRGRPGNPNPQPGPRGFRGARGLPGLDGRKGSKGNVGSKGARGIVGMPGLPGEKGDYGDSGYPGGKGEPGWQGEQGMNGAPGETGENGSPPMEEVKDLFIHALNDFQVAESGYYNQRYHVTSRDLTDGRTDTGGWGSETAKIGNYIQATYFRPVYVTSVTVAGGYIPSWGHDVVQGYGQLALEYSTDGKNWGKATTFPSPKEKKMIKITFQPITAEYWRLRSTEDNWVGTTEFALKPLL